MDVHDPQTRSYNMSRIKGKQTKSEELVAKYLFSHGLRYRRNVQKLPGKPDIVLKKYKTVIFVNGCFWHVHEGCKYFVWPENNRDFWRKKLSDNKKRDILIKESLEKSGWKVLVIWECELKHNKEKSLNLLYENITRIHI